MVFIFVQYNITSSNVAIWYLKECNYCFFLDPLLLLFSLLFLFCLSFSFSSVISRLLGRKNLQFWPFSAKSNAWLQTEFTRFVQSKIQLQIFSQFNLNLTYSYSNLKTVFNCLNPVTVFSKMGELPTSVWACTAKHPPSPRLDKTVLLSAPRKKKLVKSKKILVLFKHLRSKGCMTQAFIAATKC